MRDHTLSSLYMQSFWTTMGVVSALLLGVTFNNTVSPVSSDDEDMQTAVNVATVFGGLSLVMSLAVIICTVSGSGPVR
jgi:hypothetical protein